MKIRTLIVTVSLLVSQHLFAAVLPIDGAFGIKLGAKPGAKYGTEKVQVPDGVLYFIDPPVKNKYFDEYAILVTKATKKIHRIYAEKKHTGNKCGENLILVKNILESRYGEFTGTNKIHTLKKNQKEIRLTCRVNVNKNSEAALQLIYFDNKIFAEGQKALMIDKDDTKGL